MDRRLGREVAEARRNLKSEAERTAALRSKLVETQEARAAAEAHAASLAGAAGRAEVPPQLERAHEELQALLRTSRAEGRALRSELVQKGHTLVEMGGQLSEALEATAAAETRAAELNERLGGVAGAAELLEEAEAERDRLGHALGALQAHAAATEAQLREASSWGGGGGGAPGEGLADAVGDALRPLSEENASLRAENEAMAAELGALSPQFFEEIEDLKFHYANARADVERYASQYGPLA